MDSDFIVFVSVFGVLLAAALLVEGMETLQKWIGLKQEQLKAPPLEPRQQPVIILQREEESKPRILQPHEVSDGTPALTPRRGRSDSQGNP